MSFNCDIIRLLQCDVICLNCDITASLENPVIFIFKMPPDKRASLVALQSRKSICGTSQSKIGSYLSKEGILSNFRIGSSETFSDSKSFGSLSNISEFAIYRLHCHATKEKAGVDKKARRKLIIASTLCLLFMVGEIVGGVLAGSLAIISDAAHLLTDFASFMISLLAIMLATRSPSKRFSFGWYRAEILGALLSILFLWILTGVLFYMAVRRVIHQDYTINATIMLITAACGVAFNVIMGISLGHGHNHSHQKKQSSSQTDIQSSQQSSVQENITHPSYGAINSHFKPEWRLADPICTFVFSLIVMVTTFKIFLDIITVLMEGTPRGIDISSVRNSFLKLPGVKDVHDLRLWSLSMDKIALSVHLAVDSNTDPLKILKLGSAVVRMKYGISETTIQVEEHVEEMNECTHCQVAK
ncbi:proton-coupled zinc antiporter SLC30A2-like [Saccostrea cucullata]|uniref:proton-coupled zinc antiporter SLC30A2-like n=1 Tax=Saccostrea cuccullata TaxID=36930 RepID=UPI002ED14E41